MDKRTFHTNIVDFLSDIIVEPLLFAFAIFMLFSRIQAIMQLGGETPAYSFWTALVVDMEVNTGVYIGFFVVFALWATLKWIKHRRDVIEKKQLDNVLEQMNANSSDLQRAIKDLPDKIAESIKLSRSEDNESK